MARLPQIRPSGITANPSQASASAVEGRAAASAFATIGQAAGQERERLQPYADQLAEEMASNRLADYDEARRTGVPPGEIALRRELTRQDQIYNRVIEDGLGSRLVLDAEETARRLDRENEYDAAGYQAAADAFMEEALRDVPLPIAQRAQIPMQQRFSRGAEIVSDRVRANKVQEGRDSILREMASIESQLQSIASSRGADGQAEAEYVGLMERFVDLGESLGINPAYGVSEGYVEERITGLNRSIGAGLLRHEIGLIQENDGYVAALEATPDIVARFASETGMSDDDRASLEGSIIGGLNRRNAGIEARRAEQARAEAEARRRQTEAQSNAYAEMLVSLARGDLTQDGIEAAREEGVISVSQWASLQTQQIARDQRELEEAAERSWLLGSSALDPTNSDHRDAVEMQFRSVMQENGVDGRDFGAAPLDYTSEIVAMAEQYGIVPETGATALNAFAVNGTPDQQATALDTIAEINRTRGPAAAQAFSSQVLDDAAAYSSLVMSGLDPATAQERISQIREARRNVNPAGMEVLRNEARDLAAEIDWNTIRPYFDSTPILPGGRPRPSEYRPMEAAMVAQAQNLFRTYYEQHGNEDMASDQTIAALRRSWGRSDVAGGTNRVMPYPPEEYYRVPGRGTTWMREQLVSEVAERVGYEVDHRNIVLVPDMTTAREAQNGLPPSYLVSYTDDDGIWQTVPERFQFDPSAHVTENDRATQANVDIARQRRADYLATLDERSDELALNAYRERMWLDSSGWMNSDELAEMERLERVVGERRSNPSMSIIDRTAAEE